MVDDVPPLPRVSLDFADWVANYTLSSPGMVLRMMMSAGRAFDPAGAALWRPPDRRAARAHDPCPRARARGGFQWADLG